MDTLHNRRRHAQCAHDALARRLNLALSGSQTQSPRFVGAALVGGFLCLFTIFLR